MATFYDRWGRNIVSGTNTTDDWIYGWAEGAGPIGSGDDTLRGWGGDDHLFGGDGNDTLFGGDDDDYLSGGTGADHLDGGDGNDTAYYGVAMAAVSVNLLEGEGYEGDALGDTYVSIENVDGSAFDDTIVGNLTGNRLAGGAGHDILVGLDGDDCLYGSVGVDILYGGDDQDHLFGGDDTDYLYGENGADVLDGGNGNDFLWGGGDSDTFIGSLGADVMRGGAGRDRVDYTTSTGRVEVNLALNRGVGGFAEGDVYESIDEAVGSHSGDTLIGNDGFNILIGLEGEDYLAGGEGDDLLLGGMHGDILNGGGDGEVGDTASYYYSSAAVRVDLGTGIGQFGDAAGDRFVLIENVEGSHFHDWLIGNAGANILNGGSGYDFLDGHGGNDTLIGQDGDDRIWGGAGGDQMYGGSGSDTFVFRDASETVLGRSLSYDVINDFAGWELDLIDLSAIDANVTKLATGNQAFAFIGEEAFTGAGQLRVEQEASLPGLWSVYGETNGDGVADLRILVFTSSLDAGDFYL